MATLRISVDRKTNKVVRQEVFNNDTPAPNMQQFYKDIAKYIIETKGINFYEEPIQAP